MSNGWPDVEIIWRWVEGAVGAIAIAASSLVGWMYRRYRQDSGKLDDHEEYIAALKKKDALDRLDIHQRKLKELDRIREETEDGRKALRLVAEHDKHFVMIDSRIDRLDGNHSQLMQALHSMQVDMKEVRRDMTWMKDVFGKH